MSSREPAYVYIRRADGSAEEGVLVLEGDEVGYKLDVPALGSGDLFHIVMSWGPGDA